MLLFLKNFNIQIPTNMSIWRDSFEIHKVLQYNSWTDNQVKTECFSLPVGQKSILKTVKLAKMANFSVESGSEFGFRFIEPLQMSECYANFKFYEILLKTHCLVSILDEFYRYLIFEKIKKESNFSKLCSYSRPVLSNKWWNRKNKSGCYSTYIGLMKKHKMWIIWSRVWPPALVDQFVMP